MDTGDVIAQALQQDRRRTRQADERQFFQILRVVLETDASRPRAPGAAARDAEARTRSVPPRPGSAP